jgi:site-specific DNA-methyltransferase (adenine-specific)
MLGDCLERIKEIESGTVDAVVADPPYGTDVPKDGYGRRHLGGRHIAGDDSLAALASVIPEFRRILASPNAWVAIFCSPKKRHETESVCRAVGLMPINEVVWDKKQPGLGGGIRYQHETVLLCSFGKPKGRCPIFSVHRESVPNSPRKLHPHQKPIGLLSGLIRYTTDADATILDPFMGSGSTGLACLDTERDFIGIERDPAYFAIASKRIAAARSATPLLTHA